MTWSRESGAVCREKTRGPESPGELQQWIAGGRRTKKREWKKKSFVQGGALEIQGKASFRKEGKVTRDKSCKKFF